MKVLTKRIVIICDKALLSISLFLFLSMQPLLRDAYENNPMMTREEAKELLEKCLRVLYYRDARSLNKVPHYRGAASL